MYYKKYGEIGGKKCGNCFKYKPLEMFYTRKDTHQSRCKACNREVVLAWKRNNPESYRASYNRSYQRRKESGL